MSKRGVDPIKFLYLYLDRHYRPKNGRKNTLNLRKWLPGNRHSLLQPLLQHLVPLEHWVSFKQFPGKKSHVPMISFFGQTSKCLKEKISSVKPCRISPLLSLKGLTKRFKKH